MRLPETSKGFREETRREKRDRDRTLDSRRKQRDMRVEPEKLITNPTRGGPKE